MLGPNDGTKKGSLVGLMTGLCSIAIMSSRMEPRLDRMLDPTTIMTAHEAGRQTTVQ